MSSDAQALRERVAELEDRLDNLTRAQAEHEHVAVDDHGRMVSMDDLLAMGFTRRQALGAIAAIAGGASLATALTDQVMAQPTGNEGQVGTQANPVEVWASEIDATEVATAEGEITNETFIRATRGTSDTGNSSSSFVNLFDGESKDNRSEFNSSAQFSPDKDGEYAINLIGDIRGSTSDGDNLTFRVRNIIDTTTPEGGTVEVEASGASPFAPAPFVVNLNSAKTYEMQVTNADNSFDVNSFATSGVIRRSVVQ